MYPKTHTLNFHPKIPVIEESNEEIPETLGMLLSPKRLITYFYPLLLLHFSTSYYMNMDMGSQQKPKYKIKQTSKLNAGDSISVDAELSLGLTKFTLLYYCTISTGILILLIVFLVSLNNDLIQESRREVAITIKSYFVCSHSFTISSCVLPVFIS
jgi:hypothetical protein